jgi:hypothetical protein
MSGGATVERVSRGGRAVRLAAVPLVLGALAYGTASNQDDLFPVGPMAQYATATDLNGSIRSAYVLADTTEGERVVVPLNPTGTGIGRAEVEGQIGRIVEDPSILQDLADAWAALHPDRPQYARLYLQRDVWRLRDGERVGPPETTVLATWQVQP